MMIDKEKFKETIHNVFDGVVSYKEDLQVGQYNVEFYFPEIRLAVEYDEEPHKYHAKEDKEREKNINKVISCDFLRVTKANQLRAINKILRLHINQFFCCIRGIYIMSAEKFIDLLKDFRGILDRQQIKTLKGQALSGDLSGALKGLERITK